MNKIIERIKTVLGEVELTISFSPNIDINTIVEDDNNFEKIEVKRLYKTEGSEITLSHYKLPSKIYSGDELISIRALIIKFKKKNNSLEKIKITIKKTAKGFIAVDSTEKI